MFLSPSAVCNTSTGGPCPTGSWGTGKRKKKRENNQCPNQDAWFWGNAECGGSLNRSLPTAVAVPPPVILPPPVIVPAALCFRAVGPAVALLLLERKPGLGPATTKPPLRSSAE